MFGLSKVFLGTFAACSLLSVLLPQIDLCVSSLFFSAERGEFVLENDLLVKCVYHAVKWAGRFALLFLIVGLGVSFAAKRRLFGLAPKAFLYLLLVLLIGPILVVNTLFKNNWLRARPIQVEEFGGTKKFTRAFAVSGASETSGSWPCGHAAFGFFFVSVAMLLRRRRALAIALACALGALIGLARMVQGSHFLSDVVSAFFFVFIVARVLYYFMYESKAGSAWQWRGVS